MSNKIQIQLRALQKGDANAFKQLFEHFYDMLYYYALTFKNAPELAEEFTQEAFLMLWEKRKKFTEGFNVKAYLFKCIHNQALNYIRHEKVVQTFFLDTKSELPLFEKQNSEPWLKVALNNAIDDLPERTQQVFILSRIDGLRHKEIAEKLGITEKTVEVQVRKARLTLQKKLKRFYKEL